MSISDDSLGWTLKDKVYPLLLTASCDRKSFFLDKRPYFLSNVLICSSRCCVSSVTKWLDDFLNIWSFRIVKILTCQNVKILQYTFF